MVVNSLVGAWSKGRWLSCSKFKLDIRRSEEFDSNPIKKPSISPSYAIDVGFEFRFIIFIVDQSLVEIMDNDLASGLMTATISDSSAIAIVDEWDW